MKSQKIVINASIDQLNQILDGAYVEREIGSISVPRGRHASYHAGTSTIRSSAVSCGGLCRANTGFVA